MGQGVIKEVVGEDVELRKPALVAKYNPLRVEYFMKGLADGKYADERRELCLSMLCVCVCACIILFFF